MMDGEQTGSGLPNSRLASGPDARPPDSGPVRLEESCFGAPILFDLTTVQDIVPDVPPEPTVYYFATLPLPQPKPFPWKTVAGFGSVVLGGVSLGLLIAALLLPV